MEPTRELTTVLFVLAPVMVLTVLLGLVVLVYQAAQLLGLEQNLGIQEEMEYGLPDVNLEEGIQIAHYFVPRE